MTILLKLSGVSFKSIKNTLTDHSRRGPRAYQSILKTERQGAKHRRKTSGTQGNSGTLWFDRV